MNGVTALVLGKISRLSAAKINRFFQGPRLLIDKDYTAINENVCQVGCVTVYSKQ